MLTSPHCAGHRRDGAPCRAYPRLDSRYCFLHDPDSVAAAADAQRLGGLRRRRESTVAGAYDLPGVRTSDDLLRVVEIGILDLRGLEPSINRSRALFSGAGVAAKLLETGELADRMSEFETLLRRHTQGTDEDVA